MSDIDNPSEATILKTTCNANTCSIPPHENAFLGTQWRRQVTMPNLMYFGTGTHDTGGMKTLEEKSKYAKERSKIWSKNDGIDERKHEDKKAIKKQISGK